MQQDARHTYENIKQMVLEVYYKGCRDHALKKGWGHAQIMGFVDYQFETYFEHPVEQLMFWTVELTLSGGWHTEQENKIRMMILKMLREHNISELLLSIPKEEEDVFKHDLTTLKLI